MVTVEKVYQALRDKYELKLIAGEEGLFNMVQWISVIDNNDIIPYMRPTELAVTTGFAIKQEEELLQICTRLQEKRVSGFIINTGPYIPEIPENIIEYCNHKGFPLFTLPWEIRLIDIINETDQLMIYNSHMNENVAEIFKDYIFIGELRPEHIDELERNGFGEKESYRMILIEYQPEIIADTLEVPIESIRNDIERKISAQSQRFVIIPHYNQLMLLIIENSASEMKRIIGYIYEMLRKKYTECGIYMQAGPENMKFKDMGRYYKEMNAAFHLAKRMNRSILFYEELDLYKLLLAFEKKAVLAEYYEEIFGSLLKYDKINHMDSIDYLKKYVELNGNIQDMAKKYYVHRNTITYKLKKIEKITGLDLDSWNDRLKMQICLLIHDFL